MKNLILILSMILITGCGGGSGSDTAPDTGVPPSLPPTCKSLYNIWQADLDQERFDFTNLANGLTIQEYEFKASNGTTCGYVSNPNHNLTARIQVATTGAAYDYLLKMRYSLIMGGQCSLYENAPGDKNQTAVIYMTTCNQIEICLSTGLGTCKTFH